MGFFERDCRPAVSSNRIEIFVGNDGKTTVALQKQDGKVIKKAIAKCHPDDEFDFEIGSKLAFDRLMENYWEETIQKQNSLIETLAIRNLELYKKINKIKGIAEILHEDQQDAGKDSR